MKRCFAWGMLLVWGVGAGCTSLREIPPRDYVASVPKRPVKVVTRDSLVYELDSASIEGDSLVGYRRKDVEGPVDEYFTLRLALDDVKSISSRRIDWYRTGLIGGVAVGAVVAAGLSRHRSNNDNGPPCDPNKDPNCTP